MNEVFFAELSTWLIKAGLAGKPETDIVNGFCDRSVAGGFPLERGQLFIDTPHPVHRGRLFRWALARPSRLWSSMAGPTRMHSPRRAPIQRMSRRPSAGGRAP